MIKKDKPDLILSEVLIGIRFQRRWHTLDILGKITDDILHNPKSPFYKDYFTEIVQQSLGRELANKKTKCFLRLDIDNLIFKHVLNKQEDVLVNKDLSWFYNESEKYIVHEILARYNFEQINRIGLVYYYEIPKEDVSLELIRRLSGKLQGELAKFSLDFHKKSPIEQALAIKGVDDYINIIHFIKSKDDNTYEAGIDYQHYFSPSIDKIAEFDLKRFFNVSKHYLEEAFNGWLLEKMRIVDPEK